MNGSTTEVTARQRALRLAARMMRRANVWRREAAEIDERGGDLEAAVLRNCADELDEDRHSLLGLK